MIAINRLPEPPILAQNKEKWLAAFLRRKEDGRSRRPPSNQYAHPQIQQILAILFHRVLDTVRLRQIQDGRNTLSIIEKETLATFAQPDYAFSLMFRVYLAKLSH